MQKRKAFTLIEVLVSIALLGIILVPLFSVVDMMRKSNTHILKALKSSQEVTKASKVLFLDILSSDGTLEIKKDEFTRLCIDETKNSLYNLPVAKVCWVVLKKKNTLVRIEGYGYKLPLKSEDKVEVDSVMEDIDLFDVYQQKDKVLVFLRQQGKEPISFMLQGITSPVLRILADGTKIMKDGRKILPDGTQIFKDGSKILPNGTIVPAPKHKARSKVKTAVPNGNPIKTQGGSTKPVSQP
ncbi:MAG TPA: type II secretion system protein [Epsilonproteobacteria bacterium]|nr:type II secretion system protein [Campylobacterota bacterium]